MTGEVPSQINKYSTHINRPKGMSAHSTAPFIFVFVSYSGLDLQKAI